MAALAVVRDLREHWAPASAEELERFETDVLSGFVLARASAGAWSTCSAGPAPTEPVPSYPGAGSAVVRA
ncbi:hypothetical protein ACFY0A_42180 [Streptomyces sp. NPDC001698]|uniref:hypothetical protein n=1 Tax=unclassified Streptomyces TaxID=2593676 RepID=UPI0036C1529A